MLENPDLRKETVALEGIILNQTDEAIQFALDEDSEPVYLPKAAVVIEDQTDVRFGFIADLIEEQEVVTIEIPVELAKDKELI